MEEGEQFSILRGGLCFVLFCFGDKMEKIITQPFKGLFCFKPRFVSVTSLQRISIF